MLKVWHCLMLIPNNGFWFFQKHIYKKNIETNRNTTMPDAPFSVRDENKRQIERIENNSKRHVKWWLANVENASTNKNWTMVNDEVSSFFCSLPHSIGKILLQLFCALKRGRQRIDVCGVVCDKTKIWHTNEMKKKEEEKNNTTGAFC